MKAIVVVVGVPAGVACVLRVVLARVLRAMMAGMRVEATIAVCGMDDEAEEGVVGAGVALLTARDVDALVWKYLAIHASCSVLWPAFAENPWISCETGPGALCMGKIFPVELAYGADDEAEEEVPCGFDV